MTVTGRFAPSPTGALHKGSIVAAVGSYLFARSTGGRYLVRMEDLDTPRVIPGMADDILRTLEALGLTWDGEVEYQSKRQNLYGEAFETLKAAGFAYPCGCTRADLKAIPSAPHAGEEGPPYPGWCRDGLPEGKVPRAWRLRTEEGIETTFTDLVLGPQSFDLGRTSGDFVILRADGVFAYQLAVVVDDHHQGVTQVVRGADLLHSTPRQILLCKYMGYPVPTYGHLPLVTNADGTKLSKRDNLVSLAEGRGVGAESGGIIFDALEFLGQKPPAEMRGEGGEALLKWGVENFKAAAIPSEAR